MFEAQSLHLLCPVLEVNSHATFLENKRIYYYINIYMII